MRRVSERALEINVNEGLVNVIRRWSNVFLKHLSTDSFLREEALHRCSSSVNLVRMTNCIFGLQYGKT